MVNSNFDVCWITVNRACNLRCSFCYARDTSYRIADQISPSDIDRIIAFCHEGNIHEIVIIGGEPTLYPELADIVKKITGLGMRVSIVSNGVRYSSIEFCRSLKEAGLKLASISLKGNNENDFKEVTGVSSFREVLKGMDNLRELDIPFGCSMVISQQNISTFLEGVKCAFDRGANYIEFTFAYEFNESLNKDEDYLAKEKPISLIKQFVSQIDELNRITDSRWNIESGFPLCIFGEDNIEKLRCHITSTCQLLCGSGIIFDPDLNVIPCNMMFDIKVGKFGVDFNTFEEFLDYTQNEKYKQPMDYLKSLPSRECLDCEFLKYCGGGCVAFWTNVSFDQIKDYIKNQTINDLKSQRVKEIVRAFDGQNQIDASKPVRFIIGYDKYPSSPNTPTTSIPFYNSYGFSEAAFITKDYTLCFLSILSILLDSTDDAAELMQLVHSKVVSDVDFVNYLLSKNVVLVNSKGHHKDIIKMLKNYPNHKVLFVGGNSIKSIAKNAKTFMVVRHCSPKAYATNQSDCVQTYFCRAPSMGNKQGNISLKDFVL